MKNIGIKALFLFIFLAVGCAGVHQGASSGDLSLQKPVKAFSERHSELFNAFDGYHEVFYDYARQNGYSSELAAKVVVLHEILHVDSAAHLAFSTTEGYLGPYVGDEKWPGMDFEYVAARMDGKDRDKVGGLYRKYIKRNPGNSLPNIIDEINVYSQTVSYLKDDPAYDKYKRYMTEYLYFLDTYLRILRDKQNDAYVGMYEDPRTAKLFYTVIMQAREQYSKQEKNDMAPDLENITDFMSNIYAAHKRQ